MSDKILYEVRLVETDDGFRLEVKGDKEQLRGMGFGPRMMRFGSARRGFGPGMPFGWPRRHGRFRHRGHHHHGPGPWNWAEGDPNAEADNNPKKPSETI